MMMTFDGLGRAFFLYGPSPLFLGGGGGRRGQGHEAGCFFSRNLTTSREATTIQVQVRSRLVLPAWPPAENYQQVLRSAQARPSVTPYVLVVHIQTFRLGFLYILGSNLYATTTP